MVIRPATENDLPQLLVLKQTDDPYMFLKYLKEMQRNEGVFMVAEDEGRVVGQVYLAWYGKPSYPQYPDIRDLRVMEDKQGAGIGTELISVCEQLAIQRGFNTIGLAVNPTVNARARRLYERLGFLPTGDQPYLDAVVGGVEDWVIDMTKRLTSSGY